ncbi:MAG: TolC family protein [Acidobacteria bacterium]|nr:TolC family protein [Acidobacteriota bacterium]
MTRLVPGLFLREVSVRAFAALTLALALAGPVAAGDLDVSTAVTPVPELSGLDLGGEQLDLSLETAVEIALQRNLGLVLQRYDFAESLHRELSERGIYDLGFQVDTSVSSSASPATSTLAGARVVQTDGADFNFGFRQLTPFGGEASLQWANSRSESNSSFANPSPSFTSGFNLGFTQPLLRGFGRKATERGILLAKKSIGQSRETFELQVIDTLRQVDGAYWNLVSARKQLEVSQQSLDLAKELHERNRIRVEVGTLAPFELVQSEAGIAQREGDIIRNQAAVGDAEDALRRLLNLDQGPAWSLSIVPVSDPGVEEMEIDLGAALATALQKRPEIRQQQLELDRLEIDAHFFANQKRPRLDLQVGYGASAVDGRFFAEDPDTGLPDRNDILQDGDILDAFTEALKLDADGWSVGLIFAIPLQNRSARAQSLIADLALERGNLSLTDLQQQIATEVRSSVRQVEAAAREVDAARASKRAQEKSLEAERKRFENGMSTSFQVLQIQENLAEAQSTEVQAVTNFRSRLVDYYLSIGSLLEERGIRLTSLD